MPKKTSPRKKLYRFMDAELSAKAKHQLGELTANGKRASEFLEVRTAILV